jgi:shikimate kinase
MIKKPRIIYLVGYMGCGKTTAGKRLASVLEWNFLDLDDLIVQKYSQSIEEIFMLSGEKTFRKYESEILHNLNIETDTIISVGGGAPCFSDNMEFMKMTGKVIYLKMTSPLLKERLAADKKPRPLLKGLKEEELEKFIELRLIEREPFYMEAGLIVDGSDPDIGFLAQKAMQMFRGRGE